jgi:KUP system potassium uptake protein
MSETTKAPAATHDTLAPTAATHAVHGNLAALALGALGVVFGDIGTSPLYTLKECTSGPGGTEPANVLGVLSLIFWALMMVVTLKYLTFIMRADNHGEGGILALLALLPKHAPKAGGARIGVVALLVIAGAALLYGDGIITPAISVLSAMEGLEVATDQLKPAIVPLTCVILVGLFAIQSRGTGTVGKLFGPVMIVWFLTIGGLGVFHIVKNPAVLHALSPLHGVHYFTRHGGTGFAILGSVVLAVTGGEALYADMGHFGAKSIRVAWLGLVLPSLVLAYFGQGALILADPKAQENPFFAMVPTGGATYALVALSAAATVIASQALISGAFSLTHQAVQLGYFPRVTVTHTSRETEGQIYVPQINWGLAIACLILVLTFKESSKLAAAYGIAVSGTMGITSIAYYVVTRKTWGWPVYKALPLVILFLSFDLPFFAANCLKFLEGGYVPILVGAAFLAVMVVWRIGRSVFYDTIIAKSPPMDDFIANLERHCTGRVPGTAIFMASLGQGAPPTLIHHAQRIHVLHEKVVLLTIEFDHVPVVEANTRAKARDLGKGFWRVVAHYGFMEQVDVPALLADVKERFALPIDLEDATYYLGRETFLATEAGEMGAWTEGLFAFLSRNAKSATSYFAIPPKQVVELGTQIDL